MLIMIDLDNTLGDRDAAVRTWISGFVAEQGGDANDASWLLDLDNDGYSSRIEVFQSIKDRFNIAAPVAQLVAAYQADIVQLTRPVSGATTCLADMRQRGWTIVIVTNGSTQQQNAKIDHLGFRAMVDGVVVSETLGIKKPSAGIFEHAAACCGLILEPGGTHWMVGDSPRHDIEGAHALGLSTAWVHRDRVWPENMPRPDVVVSDLSALPAQMARVAEQAASGAAD